MRSDRNLFSADLISVIPTAVYVCNADAVIVSYNKRAAELWGRAPKLGDTDLKFCGAHKLFRPDGTYLPHRHTPMESVLRTSKAACDEEVIIERPDGSRISALVNIAPLFDRGGALIGAVNCFQDLSAHKQSEEERGHLREALHQAQKIYSLGQLTGGIAHDFNNLLGEISGALDLIRWRIDAGRTDGVLGFIEDATKSAQRAAALTHRLLAFSRRQTLDMKPVDVNARISDMGDMLRRVLGEDISFELQLAVDAWPALTDANQLESALLNLVINGRDAMAEGGRLTVRTVNIHLDDDRAARMNMDVGDYVLIDVSDTGCGMSADTIALAFDPFFTTKPIGQGTGLGLSMVYGFAKQSGGHVEILSEVSKGASVKVYLHRSVKEEEPPKAVVNAGALRGEGQAVLVVEDNETLRSVMTEAIKELGYLYFEAKDASSAIPILKSAKPIALLVTDVGLPGVNGRKLAEIARTHRPDLKVLFVTGHDQKAHIPDDIHPLGAELLLKPFTLEALGAKMKTLIES